MQPLEHQVQCSAPLEYAGGNERLRFTLDGFAKLADLRIGALNKKLVSRLPDHVIDLIEIATLVYAVDASVSRGGNVDQQMGAKWHRQFNVEMSVRCLKLWAREDVKRDLEETLMFLSDDRFRFSFVQNSEPENSSKYFDFGEDNSWQADSIVMFSGGLDSFAGVLEELIERGNRVALISHHSAPKIAKIQTDLQKAIGKKLETNKLKHIPIKIQLAAGTQKEGTHRTRSFLFAVLGIANAYAFGLKKVRFYENGVVSLNLSPVTNAVGTRATRTTHPQTLTRFSNLFSRIFGEPYRIENPFFWRTKKEVVEIISKLEFAGSIAHTRSCADVRNSTIQHPHCGRCSQCIDRRFAMFAAGLERYDPEEAYKVDLMDGLRENAVDREIALSYVRSAVAYENLSYTQLEQNHPEISRAVAHLDEPEETSLKRLTALLRRHGTGVAGVLHKTLETRPIDEFEEHTLPRMFGEIKSKRLIGNLENASETPITESDPEMFKMNFEAAGKKLVINGVIEITARATCDLLFALAKDHLRGAGQGLDFEDYPMLTAYELANALGLADDSNVRRRISRSRGFLRQTFDSAGYSHEDADALIETLPRFGYRLAPERVKVLIKT